jgi:dCTP deaminase
MILSHNDIVAAVNKKDIIINPFEEKQLQPASYDLRVGKYGATTSKKAKVDIERQGYLLLEPGDFAVVEVFEELTLSNSYAARFGLRSKYARKGLIATTGTQIDPGYNGILVIGITNLTPRPISLPFKDDFVTVEFHKLENPATHPYSGPYQNKKGIGAEEIEAIVESEGMALSEVLTTLRSLSSNVGALTTDVTKMTSDLKSLKWFIGVLVAVLAILVTIILIVK